MMCLVVTTCPPPFPPPFPQLGYDVWGGYLSPVSDAYRKAGLAPARHRLAMCAAAADSCPLTMLDPWCVGAVQPREGLLAMVWRAVRLLCSGQLSAHEAGPVVRGRGASPCVCGCACARSLLVCRGPPAACSTAAAARQLLR